MAKNILLLNGPNLNLLGTREPAMYGSTTLPDVEKAALSLAKEAGVKLDVFQTNHEGAIIDRIHQARLDKVDGIVINPGAFTHQSVALRDALVGVSISFVEVHVTNIHAREAFRHHSYLSDKAVGVVAGLGVYGYTIGLEYLIKHLKVKD